MTMDTPPEKTGQDAADAPGEGSPAPYLPPRRTDRVPSPAPKRNRRWWIAGGIVGALALVLFVVWPLLASLQNPRPGDTASPAPSVSRNADPGVDGIIAREVPPVQVEPGDCLADFSSVNEPSTVVECGREHEAQLVGRKLWPATRAFPADMKGDAEAFCATVPVEPPGDAQVIVEISHPAEGTWAEGDRRVDCIAVAHEGVLRGSLVGQPVVEDWTASD
jgi:hypothetical protein